MKPKHLFSAAVAVLLLAGCSNDTETVSPSGLVLDPTTLEIVKGETYTLRATVEPADAAYGQISWVSDAPEIASVDADGTWSTELAADKQCIGIVFAVGHSEYDASDYSSTGIGKAKCNGYVIALNDASTSYAMWGPKGQELGCYPKDEFGDPIQNGRENGHYNDWSGYLYSCLAKADADQNGGLSAGAAEGHPLFYYAMVAYADAVPAPGSTSGWFLPAISQLYQSLNVADRIASVEGGKKLANDWYGSSSEAAVDNPGPQDYFRYLMNMGTPSVSADGKDGAWFYARSVLAF